MKTLYDLALQYKSDVEHRIKCLQNEKDDLEPPSMYDEDTLDDYDAQIAHWEATLAEINKALNPPKIVKRFKLICLRVDLDEPIIEAENIETAILELLEQLEAGVIEL